MRLDALGLSAYGHFTGARLALPPPGPGAPDLHVIYGPNEAGKSTLLSAWLDLLFGFPNVTPYDFLHEKRALRVEADLRDAQGAALALARLKGNKNTLLDAASDQPVAEQVMAALLGGLDRDAYTTMFSLDEATLIKGGDAILSSQGNLGELLFQATAGLAALGDTLRDLRTEADEWFRPRARKSTRLHALKAELQELTEARKAADLGLGAWRKLVEDVEQAEAAYQRALAARSKTQRAHDAHAADLAALNVLARLDRDQARLSDLPPPQDLPESWAQAMPDWLREEAALAALIPQSDDRLARLQTALDDLPDDRAALDYLPDLDDLQQDYGAVSKELADLPKRRDEHARLADQMGRIMAELGLPEAAPDSVQLPRPKLAEISALLEDHADLTRQIDTAQAELDAARARLAEQSDAGGQDMPDAQALQRLQALLAQLRAQDPARAALEAGQALAQAQGAEARAFAALAPWQGDARALSGVDLPAPDSLRALQSRLNEAEKTADSTQAQVARLRGSVAQLRAAVQTARAPTAQELRAARNARDALWQAHLNALTQASAEAFAAALDAHDRLMEDALAAARHAERLDALAQQQAALALAEDQHAQASAALDALAEHVAQLWARVDPGAGARSLADLLDWQARRAAALEALAQRDAAELAHQAQRDALAQAQAALAAELRGCGREVDPDAGFAALLTDAEALRDAAAGLAAQRQALARLRRDVETRKQRLAQLDAAQSDWQRAWAAALAPTWLPAETTPAQMRPILTALAELTPLQVQAAELAHRIARITQDADAFAARLGQIAAALGEDAGDTLTALWPRLRARLRQAAEAQERRARLQRELEEARAARADLTRRVEALADATAPLRGHFGGQELTQIAEALAQNQRAQELAARVAETEAELARDLGGEALSAGASRLRALDVAAAQVARDTLAATLKAQDQALREAYAALASAQGALEQAGQDGDAAQLEERRQTLLLQIRAEAQDYLGRQAGILAVEQALRRYRDTHRSAMMQQAAEAFSVLSCGAYDGLTTRPDGKGEMLFAQAAGGGARPVDALSTGTRAQLYLALRVAGYLELARSQPMVPFVADDIMESFDDTRAAAAFRVLGQMAQKGQVIYLTHHAHLCDIARQACPQVQIHDMAGMRGAG